MRHNRPKTVPTDETINPVTRADRDSRDNERPRVQAQIATVAARLIAEGLTNYHSAKQKAARQLGMTKDHALPGNHEIEAALREHFALFASDTQPRALRALRETAIRLMTRLERFSPWLVGPVLSGIANEFSEIELELIGVEPKNFEMYLLDVGVDFEHRDVARRHAGERKLGAPLASYRLEFDSLPVVITLHESHVARQSAHSGDRLRHERAQRAEVERRFAESEKP